MKNVCLLATTPSISASGIQTILGKIRNFAGIQSASLFQTLCSNFDGEIDVLTTSTQTSPIELCIMLIFSQGDQNFVIEITSKIRKIIARANNLPVHSVSVVPYTGIQIFSNEQIEEEFEGTTSTEGSFYSNSEDAPEIYGQRNGTLEDRSLDNSNILYSSSMDRQHELKELLSPANFCFSKEGSKEGKMSEVLGPDHESLEKFLKKRHSKENLRFNKAKLAYRDNFKHVPCVHNITSL